MMSSSRSAKSDKMDVCRDFLRGRCQRDDCRYAHPPNHVVIDNFKQVMTCIDYLNGKCSRENCKYFHPPPYLMKERGPTTICKDFLRGRCSRAECRYLHSADMKEVDDKTRSLMTCRDYLNGKCTRAVCCYYHPPKSELDEATAMRNAPATAKPAAASANYTDPIEVCRDFILGRCARPTCCYMHPTSPQIIEEKRKELMCKDFQRGVCHRSDCRYYHPPKAQPSFSSVAVGASDYFSMSRKRAYADEAGDGPFVSIGHAYNPYSASVPAGFIASYHTSDLDGYYAPGPAKRLLTHNNYY